MVFVKRTIPLVALLIAVIIAGCSAKENSSTPVSQTTAKTERSRNGTVDGGTGTGQSLPSPNESQQSKGETATVVRVIDGDTIDVRLGDAGVRRVRYIGINTPERFEDYYAEATSANAKLVSGKEVRLVKDVSETDRYGRLLRYVYVGETFVNAELVKQGYAAAATYPPDVEYADYFVELAAEARSNGTGLWSGKSGRAPPETGVKRPQSQSPDGYIGNRNSKKFHLTSCHTLPASHNQVIFKSREEAVRAGYVPCKNCDP